MTEGTLLPPTFQEEAISKAYVQAIAAKVGYATATMDFDVDGVDLEVKAGGSMRPAVGMQLKATINLGAPIDGSFRYPLNIRNYNLLRLATQVPRVLVVLGLPKDPIRWVELTEEALHIRKCAYWVSLLGAPESQNTSTITVSIPEINRLDEHSLVSILERSRTGSVT